MRYEKTVDGQTINHVWDGSKQIIADVIDNQFYEADCYIRGTNLVAKYNYRNGDKSEYTYYAQNAHGDVVNLTDKDGKVTKSYKYDAFGVELNLDTNDVNVFRFCGEYFDTETGTVYLRARYYQASIGRFISRDSFAGNLGDPLSLNLYTYCANNPIRYIDPSGFSYISDVLNCAKEVINKVKKSNIKKSAEEFSVFAKAVLDSYVMGSPPPESESYGPFDTADEAALDFSTQKYSSSLYVRHEYITTIYSTNVDNKKSYYYIKPENGEAHESTINITDIPTGGTAVAYAHTHPNTPEFSQEDITNANLLNLDAYMAGPDYRLQKYEYQSQTKSIVGSFTPIGLTKYEMDYLESSFRMSWDNHLKFGEGDKNYNCADITWPTPMQPVEGSN